MDPCKCGRELELVCTGCRQIPSDCKCEKDATLQKTGYYYSMTKTHETN